MNKFIATLIAVFLGISSAQAMFLIGGQALAGGVVRAIFSVSTNTSAGATAGTDYVYLCSGTITITLPTAVGNTNLYTVKNVGTGVCTIATTSSQTQDGSSTVTLSVKNQSVTEVSDNANWNLI